LTNLNYTSMVVLGFYTESRPFEDKGMAKGPSIGTQKQSEELLRVPSLLLPVGRTSELLPDEFLTVQALSNALIALMLEVVSLQDVWELESIPTGLTEETQQFLKLAREQAAQIRGQNAPLVIPIVQGLELVTREFSGLRDITAEDIGPIILPVADSTSIVEDVDDDSKRMRIDVGAVSVSTVRILIMPDNNVDLADVATNTDHGNDTDNPHEVIMDDVSGTATTTVSMNTQKISAVVDPTEDQHAATKLYVDDLVIPVDFVPTSVSDAAEGTIASGDEDSLATIGDADVLEIDEETGAPGFNIAVEFTGVDEVPNQCQIYAYYLGSPSHTVEVQIQVTIGGAWDTIGTIPNTGTTYVLYKFDINLGSVYLDGTDVHMRLYHTVSGVATHDLFVDQMILRKMPPGGGGGGANQLVDLLDVTAKTGYHTSTTVVMHDRPTILIPTIGNFTNATHDHSDAAGGGATSHEGVVTGNPHSVDMDDVSGTATATVSMNTQKISAVVDPTEDQHAATKKYVDDSTPTIAGVVFFIAATGSGVISDKVYESNTVPSDKILTSLASDNNDITITLEIHTAADGWQPASVTISGGGVTPVQVDKQDWTQIDNGRMWTASVNLPDADTTGTLTATMSDGDTATCSYTRALDPPLVLTAIIDDHSTTTGGDGECPYAQTQVKEDDTLDISGTCEAHADEVYVKDSDVTNGQGLQGPFACDKGSPNAWSGTIDVGSGTDSTSFYTCYAKVTGGTAGDDKVSTESVDKDQTVPTFSAAVVTYPGTQEAIKDSETVTVTITHTNIDAGDDCLYSDNGTSELTIPNTTTYLEAKLLVERASGNYRHDGMAANYKLQVTRTAKNGAVDSRTCVVEIAHTAPVITVVSYSALDGTNARLRTDDGTNNYYDHQIRLSGNQRTLSTDTPEIQGEPVGTFQGSWSEQSTTEYRRNLRIADGDIVVGGQGSNTYAWNDSTTVSWVNRAEKETTTVTTGNAFTVGGFDERTLTIPAYPNREADCSVLAVDTGNLTSENLSKGGAGPNGGTVFTFDNSPGSGTPDDETDKFCMTNGSDAVDDDGAFWYNKDLANAESNTSGTAQVIVEETA